MAKEKLTKTDKVKIETRKDFLRFATKRVSDVEVGDYDQEEFEVFRQEINEILKYINNQDFLNMVEDTVSKQYNTILMEQQDINTFNDLVLEKERKSAKIKVPGAVVKILVKEGEKVEANQPIAVLEAMKMETNIISTTKGTVDKIYVKEG